MNPLFAEGKYVIDIKELPDNTGYTVEWQEHKTYIAVDGQEYFDEVWTTQDGTPLLIQDIEEAHCRNILRMLLRKRRESADLVNDLTSRLADVLDQLVVNNNGGFDAEFSDDIDNTARTLH